MMPTQSTRPEPVQTSKPVRARPDWPTYRGYLGIVLGALLAFVLTERAAGLAQLVFILIWIALIAAIVSFTKYDRRRRLTGKDR
jgi:uncharacterized membrane protein HdeD (DUF308 family)